MHRPVTSRYEAVILCNDTAVETLRMKNLELYPEKFTNLVVTHEVQPFLENDIGILAMVME